MTMASQIVIMYVRLKMAFVESQCWGSAVDNGAGQCITDARTLSCSSGEQGVQSTDGSSLICSIHQGRDVPRTVSCNEGEQEICNWWHSSLFLHQASL